MTEYPKKPKNENEKRYEGTRKPYHGSQLPNSQFINQQYKGDKPILKDRKKGPFHKSGENEVLSTIAKLLPDFAVQLGTVSHNQLLLIEIMRKIGEYQEQISASLASIAESLKQRTFVKRADAGKAVAINTRKQADEENSISEIRIDQSSKQKVIDLIVDFRKDGLSYSQIARRLDAEKIQTFSGKGKWHPQTVQKIGKAFAPDQN